MCSVMRVRRRSGIDPLSPVISVPPMRTPRHAPMGQWASMRIWTRRHWWNIPPLPAQIPAGRRLVQVFARTVSESCAPMAVAISPLMAIPMRPNPFRPPPKMEIVTPVARRPPGNPLSTIASMRKLFGNYMLMTVVLSPPMKMVLRADPRRPPPKRKLARQFRAGSPGASP